MRATSPAGCLLHASLYPYQSIQISVINHNKMSLVQIFMTLVLLPLGNISPRAIFATQLNFDTLKFTLHILLSHK